MATIYIDTDTNIDDVSWEENDEFYVRYGAVFTINSPQT